jgi:hypothetical protein
VSVLAWINRRQDRDALPPAGTQASFAVVQRIPFCQTAERSRSSRVSRSVVNPFCTTLGGNSVATICRSYSIRVMFG